ncbi:hypothetical protein Hbl1158_01870 [Halobaculum sp. CBA1158]|uniref:DUF7853 family protein n=1 Tax=Halobaculum sp. CBA1158 TaxID=2904243 RepID=UPI001F19ABF5|nr:hypothetical protein [Halobaculum sp. CBA1158]UIP00143.1 hypothetical protein Hbl1158_01870 [Halobaculum sp. CBA1158]
MAGPVERRRRTLAFSREEAWVVHVALLDRIRSAVEDDGGGRSVERYAELDALSTLEGENERFSTSEVAAIRAALRSYLPSAPPRDLLPGREALRRVDGDA